MTVLSFLFNLSIIYDYAALCGIIFFQNLERPWRDIEIDRNWRPQKLLKLGRGQKMFIFRGCLPYERRGGEGNFLEGGSYSSACFGILQQHFKFLVTDIYKSISCLNPQFKLSFFTHKEIPHNLRKVQVLPLPPKI